MERFFKLLSFVFVICGPTFSSAQEPEVYCGQPSYIIRTGYEYYGETTPPQIADEIDANWTLTVFPIECDETPGANPIVDWTLGGPGVITEGAAYLWPYFSVVPGYAQHICGGTYIYQTEFCLDINTREGMSNIQMDLKALGDNRIKVYLNGYEIGAQPETFFPSTTEECFDAGFSDDYMIVETITNQAFFNIGIPNILKVVLLNVNSYDLGCDTMDGLEPTLTASWFSLYAKITANSGCISNCGPVIAPACDVCTSFMQDAQAGRYWVSAWVKVDYPDQVKSYDEGNSGAHLKIDFWEFDSNTLTAVNFYPTGEIIDGWQRVVGAFDFPVDPEDMAINLNAHPTYTTYFDDIRIHPFNASMKSYVYDGETFWLVSELDDNNYATFYEYDEEGGLIRIKKETARGIVTIQETRSSTIKQ